MLFQAIGVERFILASRKIWKRGVRPDLAMRMRIARAHEFAAVLEDLHVTDPRNLRERRALLGPGVHHAAQFARVHSRNGEIVAGRKAQDTANAAIGLGNEQTILFVLQWLHFGQKRGEVVLENIRFRIFGRLPAAGALISRAKIAVGIVSDRRWRGKLLHFSLPRALRPLRRDQDPLSQERIESFVRSGEKFFEIHDEGRSRVMVTVFEAGAGAQIQQQIPRFARNDSIIGLRPLVMSIA